MLFFDVSVNSVREKATTQARRRDVYLIIKHCFDFVFSILLLIVLLPFFLLICLLICISSKGPIIYKHRRVGKNGRPLDVLKFRTMVPDADKQIGMFTPLQMLEWQSNYKVENDPRVTGIGRILRMTSLDELPQLVNVIKGELSLVGPRPVTQEEADLYGPNRDKFLSVTPGLTGYWQAYARSDCSYEQRMKMELDYVEHRNLLWDIRILFKTVERVVSCRGAK